MRILSAIILMTCAGSVPAQDLAARIAAAGNGTVRLSYSAREGVCGNGSTMINTRHGQVISRRNHEAEWDDECTPGPVRVAMGVRNGEVQSVRAYVGGRWRSPSSDVTDLGMVSAPAAARVLMQLAATAPERAAKEAIFPATLADSVEIWPQLLALARNGARPREVRKSSVFWLSQVAGDRVTTALDSVVNDASGDREIRKQAVFALSQRPREEGVPALIRVARSSRDAEIRKSALFWLGQSGDERAIALFEEILTRPR